VKDARRAVVAFLAVIAAIAAAFIGVIASGGKGSPWHDTVFVVWVIALIITGVVAFAAALPDFAEWLGGPARKLIEVARGQPKLVTDRWLYTSDGLRWPASVPAQEIALPGTGYRRSSERPPWVRVVVLVASSPLGSDADGKQLWAKFEAFLGRKPIASLVGQPVDGRTGLRWTQWSTNVVSAIDAVLTTGGEEDAIASARLELPDKLPRFGRDARFAMLILHFEPARKDASPPPAAPDVWEERLVWTLDLPQALSQFATSELGLTAYGEPPAQVAVRLEAQEDMAEMIDVAGMKQLPGRPNTAQGIGYFIASRDGDPAEDAAKRMVTDVLRYALNIDR